MSSAKLILEIISGPLDGFRVELEKEENWSCQGKSSLVFPWDLKLGSPQARIFPEAEAWWIEGHKAPHGTYIFNAQHKVEEKIRLEEGEVLKASSTWIRVISC